MTAWIRRARAALGRERSVVAGAVLLGCVGLRFALLGGAGDHVVTVRFADADGLVGGNEVRVAGVAVGHVDAIGIVHDATVSDPRLGNQFAEARLVIDDSHWPLHQGTTFAVRPRGVLSDVVVQLYPGAASGPLLDVGRPVPASQTSSPVNLDELNGLFDPTVRQALRTQIDQGVVAFGGTGAADFNQLLVNLTPLTRDLHPVTSVLAERSPELSRLNGEFATISGDLAREDSDLRGLIEHQNTLFATIANRQADLRGTLDHAASVLTSLDGVLTGEERNLTALFQKGPAALDKSKQATDLIYPLVYDVNPHIPDLDTLLRYFVTGNGYRSQNGVISLRIDANLPFPGRTSSACGGVPSEQRSNGCTSIPAAQAAETTAASGGDPQPAPFLGGLVG